MLSSARRLQNKKGEGSESSSRHLVAGVTLGSCLFRMLGLFRPVLGNFSGYQTSNGMMTQFFIERHFTNLLYPQLNVLSAGKPGLVLLAYPVSSLIAAFLRPLFGGSIDTWGRFQAVLFFGAAAFYLYRLVQAFVNSKIALGSLVVFCFSPLTIIYGQSFQNEMATVFFSLVFIFHFLQFLKRGAALSFIASAGGFTGVLATRPNGLYLLLPAVVLALQMKKEREAVSQNLLRLGGVALAGSILPALWYGHTWQLSKSASNIYSTLFAQLMLRSSFASPLVFHLKYYQALLDLLMGMTFTPIGFTFLMIGILWGVLPSPKKFFFLSWCTAFLLSSLLIPRKLVDHDFYLLHLLLPAAPLIASGFYQTMRPRFLSFFLLFSFVVSLRYALHPAFKTPEKEKYIPEIAKRVESLTDKERSRVVVQGTHALLYYSDRYGWSFPIERGGDISDYEKYTNWQKLPPAQWKRRNEAFKDPRTAIEYLREYEGATHFVVSNLEEFTRARDFKAFMFGRFAVLLEEKGKLIIFDLEHHP